MSNFFATNSIKIPLGQNVLDVKAKLAKLLGVREKDVKSVALKKQSVDARDKNNVHFVCSYIVESDKCLVKNAVPYVAPRNLLDSKSQLPLRKKCIVVGSGPSGLFLARYLSQNGVNVTVIERGGDVEKRQNSVKNYFNGGNFDSECNVQFGLGGAGTFSDGKLTTGISSPLLHTVFSEFVRCGAPKDILTDALPHIGTDNLVSIVAKLRDEIMQCGGEFLFDTFVSKVIIKDGKAVGVNVVNNGAERQLFADCVALCCGHSSRELFETLNNCGVEMQCKPFAVGLRVEHKRTFINKTQYGELFATHRDLSAASYKLVNNMDNHSCYSFCMCPGGVVVAANSQQNTVVVNGMSNYLRDAENSNSALVVTVSQNDVADWGFGKDVLSGMRFQTELERQAFVWGGGNYRAPYQNVTDFMAGRLSQQPDLTPSYPRGVTSIDFCNLLPKPIWQALQQSLEVFDNKLKNFAHCGVLTGVETRTSSPVRIVRNSETLQSNIQGIFPVGEGAGYAGGIASSAVDGLKSAQSIVNFLKNQ